MGQISVGVAVIHNTVSYGRLGMKDFNTILGVLFYHALSFQSAFNLPSYCSVTAAGVEQTCSSRALYVLFACSPFFPLE